MRFYLTLFLVIYILSAFAQKGNLKNASSYNKAERLDSLFIAKFKDGSFNGNVLVAEKGNVIFQKSYGTANEETGQLLNASSVFELASLSKQFTAMAIVQLAKRGKLSYEEPMSRYLPELAFYDGITIRDLLNHVSGLPDYMMLFHEHWNKTKFATNQDIIDLFARYRPALRFPAGEKYEYSNTGYALLATIIERIAKKSYGDFLQEFVFLPSGMQKTLVYRSRYQPQIIENYAAGHFVDSLNHKILPDKLGKTFYTYYLDGIVGDGMVNSTVDDLLKWDRVLYTNKLINDEDRESIFTPVKTRDGKENYYGFGWSILTTGDYGAITSHAGNWAGYRTYIERHTGTDKTIIMLQNNSSIKTKNPVDEVRTILKN